MNNRMKIYNGTSNISDILRFAGNLTSRSEKLEFLKRYELNLSEYFQLMFSHNANILRIRLDKRNTKLNKIKFSGGGATTLNNAVRFVGILIKNERLSNAEREQKISDVVTHSLSADEGADLLQIFRGKPDNKKYAGITKNLLTEVGLA